MTIGRAVSLTLLELRFIHRVENSVEVVSGQNRTDKLLISFPYYLSEVIYSINENKVCIRVT